MEDVHNGVVVLPGSSGIVVPEGEHDSLLYWLRNYLDHAVTTAESSRKVQVRDLMLLVRFAEREGAAARPVWTPRLSRSFMDFLRETLRPNGRRSWSDRTINRILAHAKTFARWIHKLAPFPLGDPMQNLRLMPVGENLDVERAITGDERRSLLDTADLLPSMREESGNNGMHADIRPAQRAWRKTSRPWRNRAMIYTLIETGMRRGALVNIDVDDIDWNRCLIVAKEKGGYTHSYSISDMGLKAISDYMDREREIDAGEGRPALFLPAKSIVNSSGRLTSLVVNQVWGGVCAIAGVSGRSPHSARHAMGRHIIERTGNIAAVQRQLGHRNVAYSLQYARVSNKELRDVLNSRY